MYCGADIQAEVEAIAPEVVKVDVCKEVEEETIFDEATLDMVSLDVTIVDCAAAAADCCCGGGEEMHVDWDTSS